MKILNQLKEFIKHVLIVFGATKLCVYVGFHFFAPWTRVRIEIVPELFILILVVTALRLFTEKFDFKYAILEILLEFALIAACATAVWWFFGWYVELPFPFLLLFTTVVYVLVWFSLTAKTSQDIDYINKQIQHRKDMRNKKDGALPAKE